MLLLAPRILIIDTLLCRLIFHTGRLAESDFGSSEEATAAGRRQRAWMIGGHLRKPSGFLIPDGVLGLLGALLLLLIEALRIPGLIKLLGFL